MASPAWQAAALLLQAGEAAAPVLHGMQLALALAQHLTRREKPPNMLLVTCGALGVGGTPSCAAHGGVWGFARVLRLEHQAMRTACADVLCRASLIASIMTTLAPTNETEAACISPLQLVARLRAHSLSSAVLSTAPTYGTYTVTGGLGGLGMRAATLLAEGNASRVLLASRTGRVVRDGQDVEAQLLSMGAVATAVAGDSADALAVVAFLSGSPFNGVLHAAGVGDRGLLIELAARTVQWMYASKALGAWHLQCAAATTPLATRVLFSSVGSALGNVGQANYAAGNACLDAHALFQRAHGKVACSLQWPLVGGAGMGAAAFAAVGERQVSMAGLAGILLEEYAACLKSQLASSGDPVCSVRLVHRSNVRRLLQDLAEPLQPRFGELVAQSRHPLANDDPAPVVTAPAHSDTLVHALTHVDDILDFLVDELKPLVVGFSDSELQADLLLMDGGLDSLALGALSGAVRRATGQSFNIAQVQDRLHPYVHRFRQIHHVYLSDSNCSLHLTASV